MSVTDILAWPEVVDQKLVAAHFVVQGEPVSKARARTIVRDGVSRTYTPGATKTAEGRILASYLEVGSYRRSMGNKSSRWGIRIFFYHRNLVQRDVDNMAKLVLDALTGSVWVDDHQIDRLIVMRTQDRQNPRTEVLAYIL